MQDDVARRGGRLSAVEAYSELAGIDFASHDLRAVLGRVADVAKRTLIEAGDPGAADVRGHGASGRDRTSEGSHHG
jgi:hypothetical protein